MKRNQTAFHTGSEVLESILETKVDIDVNFVENMSQDIALISRNLSLQPTLIASIYGMNFQVMPELKWRYSYPVVLLLMVASSLLTLYIFKKKRWF